MSTHMQNITTQLTNTPPSPSGSTGGSLGLNLSGGMEAAVTAAISYFTEVLCTITAKELQESRGMATAVQTASEYSAEHTIQGGVQQFTDALAEGIGTIGSAAGTLGTMGIGELKDPSKPELQKLDVEEEGIQNVQKSIPKTANANANELATPVAGTDSTEVTRVKQMSSEDKAEALNKKLEELADQKSFTDQEGKALELSDADTELLKTMDQKQAKTLNKKLGERLDNISKEKQSLAEAQSRRRNTTSIIGQALGSTAQAAGKTVGAFAKEAQAQDQADAQLSNTAVQGIQAISSQLVKTSNDALAQALQILNTLGTISNGNKFQG